MNLSTQQKTKSALKIFVGIFLLPTLVGKAFIIYFGLNYSSYPGDGYGYGLAAAITIVFLTLALFAWKYKDHEEF